MEGVDEARIAMEAGYCWQPLYDSVNITLNPKLLQRLYDGEFNVVECAPSATHRAT